MIGKRRYIMAGRDVRPCRVCGARWLSVRLRGSQRTTWSCPFHIVRLSRFVGSYQVPVRSPEEYAAMALMLASRYGYSSAEVYAMVGQAAVARALESDGRTRPFDLLEAWHRAEPRG